MGYVKTNDPLTKTKHAYQLMAEDRFLMAEDYLLSALKILKEEPDPHVEADVHYALGSLYKNEGYHRHHAQFESFGTYDGTYMKSVRPFQKAIELFKSVDDISGEAKSLIGLGSAYGLRNENEKQCISYRSALSIYNNAKKNGRITFEPVSFNPNYKTIDELAMAFICSKCMNKKWTTKEACFSNFK